MIEFPSSYVVGLLLVLAKGIQLLPSFWSCFETTQE